MYEDQMHKATSPYIIKIKEHWNLCMRVSIVTIMACKILVLNEMIRTNLFVKCMTKCSTFI